MNDNNQKHCNHCGSVISKSDKFCGGCGKKIVSSKKIVKIKTINEKYNFAELSLQEKAFYIFLILIFCSIGANIWNCDISIFLAFIICVISIAMIYFVWGLAKIRNEKCKVDIKKQEKATRQQDHPNFFKKSIKNILAFLIALGLFILAFYIFITLTDNKKTEHNYYKAKEELNEFKEKKINHDKTDWDKLKLDLNASGLGIADSNDNFYKNTEYNFSIIFPKGWDMWARDNKRILQGATNDRSVIMIHVNEYDKNLFRKFSNLEKLNIKDIHSFVEYKNMTNKVIKKFNQDTIKEDFRVLEYFNTDIHGIPAYGYKTSSYRPNKEGVMKKYIEINYQIMRGNIEYTITGSTPYQDFFYTQKDIFNTINSFQLF